MQQFFKGIYNKFLLTGALLSIISGLSGQVEYGPDDLEITGLSVRCVKDYHIQDYNYLKSLKY
jgi:hypothetical protein